MIKYYDTLAAYEADAKSAFESQVSLIGADNAIKFDGRNVIVDIRSAKTGSIAVLDGNHALHFVSVDTFGSASFMSNFEVVGVVSIGVDHPSFRGKVAIMYKAPAGKPLSAIYQYRLTGFTCDGTARTGTLSIREASDSWAANHDYAISYNAANELALVSQLNTYFKANEPFKTQGWVAKLNDDNTIDLKHKYINWQQSNYNGGKSGFTLTANLFSKWIATSYMLRANGARDREGTISNWSRALDYYRNDNGTGAYQGGRTTDQGTNTKQQYPINLPTWLGTSVKNPGDFCAGLRAIYGEGEQGWIKFMKTMLPVRPTEYGSVGDKAKYGDSMKNTRYLASQKYVDADGNSQPASPAADFAANIHYDHELLKRGQWVLPDSDLLFDVVGGIEYPTTNRRDADVINRALLAIGAPALASNSYVWSCSRYGVGGGWCSGGGGGFAINSILCYSGLAVPLVLLDVPQSAI